MVQILVFVLVQFGMEFGILTFQVLRQDPKVNAERVVIYVGSTMKIRRKKFRLKGGSLPYWRPWRRMYRHQHFVVPIVPESSAQMVRSLYLRLAFPPPFLALLDFLGFFGLIRA